MLSRAFAATIRGAVLLADMASPYGLGLNAEQKFFKSIARNVLLHDFFTIDPSR